MRILLFTGKGGVGKTTLAAASAAGLARQDRKTLVVSTDPAHSLADALGTPLDGEPCEVEGSLFAAQVDVRALVDGSWRTLREQLRSALAGLGMETLDAEELTVLPGVDELLALTEVRRLADTGPWENVVVDCGPTAETLRLFALPEAVAGYLRRTGSGPWWAPRSGPGASTAVAAAVDRLNAHVESLRALLTDRDTTSVRLVLTPERVVVSETRRLLTALALREIVVDGIVVNRVVPTGGFGWGPAASWLRSRRAQQEQVLGELRAAGFTESLRTVEHRAVEPVGAAALVEIADELYGGGSPFTGTDDVVPLLRAREVTGGFELRIALPLAEESRVALARVDDDLAVTVDGFRRLLALPEPLRPYRVTEAETDAHGVLVRLERNS